MHVLYVDTDARDAGPEYVVSFSGEVPRPTVAAVEDFSEASVIGSDDDGYTEEVCALPRATTITGRQGTRGYRFSVPRSCLGDPAAGAGQPGHRAGLPRHRPGLGARTTGLRSVRPGPARSADPDGDHDAGAGPGPARPRRGGDRAGRLHLLVRGRAHRARRGGRLARRGRLRPVGALPDHGPGLRPVLLAHPDAGHDGVVDPGRGTARRAPPCPAAATATRSAPSRWPACSTCSPGWCGRWPAGSPRSRRPWPTRCSPGCCSGCASSRSARSSTSRRRSPRCC